MPDHEVALELLSRTGPLAVSSANRTGLPAATDADAGRGDAGVVGRGDPRRRPDARGRSRPPSSTSPARPAGCCGSGAVSPRAAQRDRRRRSASRSPTRASRPPVREYLTVFLVAAVVTYLLGVVAREIALRTGAVARVRDRDVHAVPIPYFGGRGDARRAGRGVPRRPPAAVPLAERRRRSSTTPRSCSIGGAMICAARGPRRPVRARRADQARRPGAGRRLPGAQPGAVLLLPAARARPVQPGPARRRRCSAWSWWSPP